MQILLLIAIVVLQTLAGFCLGMLVHTLKVRRVLQNTKKFLNNLSEVELEGLEGIKRLEKLYEHRIKLEYVRGRIDAVGDLD
jgi:hypothetical protein